MRGLLATWGSSAFCSNRNLFRMQKEDNDFFFFPSYLFMTVLRLRCYAQV